MSPIFGKQQEPHSKKEIEAASEALDKVQKAEADKGLPPGGGVGRRVHEGRRENA